MLSEPSMTILDSANSSNTNSTSICSGSNNTYKFSFVNQITLSGLSFFSNDDVQENETLSLMCNDQKNDTTLIEVIFQLLYSYKKWFYALKYKNYVSYIVLIIYFILL